MKETSLSPDEEADDLTLVATVAIASFKNLALSGYRSHAASRNRAVATRPMARSRRFRRSHRRPRSARQRASARSGDSGGGDHDPPGEPPGERDHGHDRPAVVA